MKEKIKQYIFLPFKKYFLFILLLILIVIGINVKTYLINKNYIKYINNLQELIINKKYDTFLNTTQKTHIKKYSLNTQIYLIYYEYITLINILKRQIPNQNNFIEQGQWTILLNKKNNPTVQKILLRLNNIYNNYLKKPLYLCGILGSTTFLLGENLNLIIFIHSTFRTQHDMFFTKAQLQSSIFNESINFILGCLNPKNALLKDLSLNNFSNTFYNNKNIINYNKQIIVGIIENLIV